MILKGGVSNLRRPQLYRRRAQADRWPRRAHSAGAGVPADKAVGRRYLAKTSGRSLAQITRQIRRYRQRGAVQPATRQGRGGGSSTWTAPALAPLPDQPLFRIILGFEDAWRPAPRLAGSAGGDPALRYRRFFPHEILRQGLRCRAAAGAVAFILVAVNSPPVSPENAFEPHLPAGWRSTPPDARFRRILVVDRS